MTTYKIFAHPSGTPKTIKQGWCWPAFLVPPLWALFNRLWGLAAGAALAFAALVFFSEFSDMRRWQTTAILLTCELALRTVFAVNGNSWRELNFIMRGYCEERIVVVGRGKLAAGPAATRLWEHPRIVAIWRDPVWSKVIAGGIAAVAVSVVAYVHHISGPSRFDPRHTFAAPTCTTAILNAHVQPDGETMAWFEWGPTPELGNETRRQRVKESGNIFQHLVELSPNTVYYYRAVSEMAEGQVLHFVTSTCR
jgi:hypothetical protein